MAWLELFEDISDEDFVAACTKYKKEELYFPVPAAIRRIVLANRPSPQHLAEKAWAELLRQMHEIGYYGSPKLDAVTTEIVRYFGGWDMVCQWLTAEMPYRRKEFLDAWPRYAEQESYLSLEEAHNFFKALDAERAKKATQALNAGKSSHALPAGNKKARIIPLSADSNAPESKKLQGILDKIGKSVQYPDYLQERQHHEDILQ